MIHYIYKIINNTNGKYYLGKHSTNNINDNYMGSGKLLKQAQKKYGISNFTKLILAYANTEDEVYELEERLIKPQHVNDPMCYNLIGGGRGAKKGNTYAKGRAVSSATRAKISIANKGKIKSIEHRAKLSIAMKHKKHKKHSNETRVKMKRNTNAAKKVIQLNKDSIFIKEWISASEAGRNLNINQYNISACARGKIKSAGGFKWIKK